VAEQPYTKKPKAPPKLDMAAIAARLVAGTPLTQTQANQLIEWKQYVEASDNYDGVEGGGLRDILNAGLLGVDKLKTNLDHHGARLNTQALDIADLKAWVAAQPRPFP
jgi:hypothetical protein